MITSKQITEHLDKLCSESGIRGLELIATGKQNRDETSCAFIACTSHSSDVGFNSESAATPEETIALVRSKLKTPAQLAVEKRETAQKLVLEAELLERGVKS